jgi:uncharacterized phosphosugar-binding protein
VETPDASDGPGVAQPSSAVRAAFADTIANLDLDQTHAAADALSQRLGDDGLLYILGCGHSYLLALEGFYRAGAPAWVAPLVDERVSPLRGAAAIAAERQPGIGREMVARLQVPASKATALLVVSASGRTPVAIEAAAAAREIGLLTIGISSSSDDNPLIAHLDHVLLTGVPRGDAAVRIGGEMMGPQSTIAGVALLHCLFAETEARRAQRAVLVSVALDESESHNRALIARYPHLAPELLRAGPGIAAFGRQARQSRDRHGADNGRPGTSRQ